MQILTTLQAGKSYAVSDLSKMFGTSRRTIFRDLKELQAIGVPFHYDAKTSGYTIEPEFFLPPVDLSLQEALGLLLLAHKTRDQIQTPFKNSVLWAALKIENNLPARIRQYCNTALQNISTRPCAQAPVTHSAGLDKTFAQLQQAIVKKRKVNIRYHSLFEGTIIDVELSPYHLLYNNRAWYVLGRSSLHKSVRTFKLNRIRELTTTQRCFVDGEKFDVYDYLGRAWSMIPEGRIYNIKLRFLSKVANNVAEVQWHSTQKVVRNSDGSATVEFRVDGLGEITWWILGYGDQVQVLAPKTLRKKVLEVAKNMVELNEKI
jgi:predicted DNA-binding transcriptional regulator YafY